MGWMEDGIWPLRKRGKIAIHVLFLKCSVKQRDGENNFWNRQDLRINEEIPTTNTLGSTKIIQLGNTEIDTHTHIICIQGVTGGTDQTSGGCFLC